MFKRIAAIVLLVLMMFATACTVQRVDGGNDGEGDMFEYVTFRWGNSYYETYHPSLINSTDRGDAMLARYEELREDYGLDFIVEDMKNESSELLQRMAISQNVPDIFMGTSRKIGWELYNMDALYALNEIETIDYEDEEKWGYAAYTQCARYDGVTYGFFPNAWAEVPNFTGILMFNNEILEDAGVELPYVYQEQGNWNWSNFETILNTLKAYDPSSTPWVSGSMHDDAWYLLMSNGLSGVIEDEYTGKYVFGFNENNHGIETLEWMNKLWSQGLYGSNGKQLFAVDQTSAFYTTSVSAATSTTASVDANGVVSEAVASLVNEYGIVTFPYGPNGTSETVSANVYWTTPVNFILNKSDNDADTIGLVMDILFEPLDGVSDWREYCQDNIFHHEEDFENYMYMLEHCNYDYSVQMPNVGTVLDEYFGDAIIGEKSFTSVFEEILPIANADIEKNVGSID